METKIITVDEKNPDLSLLLPAAEALKAGGLVIFPTETVYGIGCDATLAEGAEKVYAAKGRPSDNPLIVHLSDPGDADKVAFVTPLYRRLAKAFMPGPLTVILKKRDAIPRQTTGGLDTVAVRCPSHPVANALLRLSGVPVAAPSANISGRPSATDAATALSEFDGKVDYIIAAGSSSIGLESTIVMPTGDDSLLLLRPGAVTADDLKLVCSEVKISDTVERAPDEGERPVCPGMKYRHYAPSKPFILVSGSPEDRLEYLRKASEEGAVVICYDEQAPEIRADRRIAVGEESDLSEQARRLFSALRLADRYEGDVVYANLPPRDGLGLALRNRMLRAAAHKVIDAGDELLKRQ